MDDKNKNETLQKANELLDDETRAYLKEWVNAFLDGAEHEEAKQIAAVEIKKRIRE